MKTLENQGLLPLSKKLINNDEWIVREAVAYGLGLTYIGERNKEAIELIKKLLKDKENRVRESAIIALGLLFHQTGEEATFAHILKKNFPEKKPQPVTKTIIYLAACLTSRDPIKALFEGINIPVIDKEARFWIELSLMHLAAMQFAFIVNFINLQGQITDEDILEMFKYHLNRDEMHAKSAVLIHIARAFQKTNDEIITDIVKPVLDQKDFFVKKYATLALSIIHQGSGNEKLAKELLEHKDNEVKSTAILGTGIIFQQQYEKVLKILQPYFESSDELERRVSLISAGLAFHGDNKRVLEVISKFLEEKDPYLLSGALIALGLASSKPGLINLSVLYGTAYGPFFPDMFLIYI